MLKKQLTVIIALCACFHIQGQHSAARQWNEVLLEAIRNDFARPNVHARNLFHISAASYDAWAAYDEMAVPYFLNKSENNLFIEFDGVSQPSNIISARNQAISFANYRLIKHRFENSPGASETMVLVDNLMSDLGYDSQVVSTNYATGDPAHLGNYIAEQLIALGLQDGSNEEGDYEALYYAPVNYAMVPALSGSQECRYPNRWQPLGFGTYIDQSGNEVADVIPEFLGPEWGNVTPFSLTEYQKTTYERDGDEYIVYHDPGAPAYIDPEDNSASQDYKWGHSLVAIWSSHLDPEDQTMWDISPGGIGNLSIDNFPTDYAGLKGFYSQFEGGDPSSGYDVNPKTGQPYDSQMVPRADYGRVLAEFWADGPDSETPPGHWFTILNYVNDHPELVKKYKGEGNVMDDLEWDVKSYFVLAGAMHDAAISAWSIKGYYDYIRPISAIRYMADQGQSSSPEKANFSEAGIPLIDGYIELVESGDGLAGDQDQHVGKIKLLSWRGPDYIQDEATDYAGVDWILAENWWPYQRPTFVTPPFAGYVSGHSTYSRAAAKVLSEFTGDEYFPGGMGEFQAPMNEFLVFEEGPSVDVTLQWAKYYDASDQCSLSRIWGGIHPPVDDIPGRLIGDQIGISAFELAESHFSGATALAIEDQLQEQLIIYPNPLTEGELVKLSMSEKLMSIKLYQLGGELVRIIGIDNENTRPVEVNLNGLDAGVYLLKVETKEKTKVARLIKR